MPPEVKLIAETSTEDLDDEEDDGDAGQAGQVRHGLGLLGEDRQARLAEGLQNWLRRSVWSSERQTGQECCWLGPLTEGGQA